MTLHCIHIEAAMLLFEANTTAIQVMGWLRYKLIAFQMYYPNTPALARIQAKSMELSDNYVSSPAILSDFEKDKED